MVSLHNLYYYKKKQFILIDDSALSNIGESAIGSATQLKPQVIDVQLRPGTFDMVVMLILFQISIVGFNPSDIAMCQHSFYSVFI